jgi:hypothetical protein
MSDEGCMHGPPIESGVTNVGVGGDECRSRMLAGASAGIRPQGRPPTKAAFPQSWPFTVAASWATLEEGEIS